MPKHRSTGQQGIPDKRRARWWAALQKGHTDAEQRHSPADGFAGSDLGKDCCTCPAPHSPACPCFFPPKTSAAQAEHPYRLTKATRFCHLPLHTAQPRPTPAPGTRCAQNPQPERPCHAVSTQAMGAANLPRPEHTMPESRPALTCAASPSRGQQAGGAGSDRLSVSAAAPPAAAAAAAAAAAGAAMTARGPAGAVAAQSPLRAECGPPGCCVRTRGCQCCPATQSGPPARPSCCGGRMCSARRPTLDVTPRCTVRVCVHVCMCFYACVYVCARASMCVQARKQEAANAGAFTSKYVRTHERALIQWCASQQRGRCMLPQVT